MSGLCLLDQFAESQRLKDLEKWSRWPGGTGMGSRCVRRRRASLRNGKRHHQKWIEVG